MPTYHIHLKGRVQGVGFRPHVYRLAQQFMLTGWVSNTTDGVHIEVSGDAEKVDQFYNELIQNPPALSLVREYHIHEIDPVEYASFDIIESDAQGHPEMLLSPDFAMCPSCRAELEDPANRRYNYPFITCTHCGPRYSIITDLPYDRDKTTMAGFDQCVPCAEEYNNPLDRRYYSQTNSCA